MTHETAAPPTDGDAAPAPAADPAPAPDADPDGATADPAPETETDYWIRYYEVTRDRPAWETVRLAAERFAAERETDTVLLAVDLGCGAGRDARYLLGHGWSVIAVDREQAAIDALIAATPDEDRDGLIPVVADAGAFRIPPCDLVTSSVALPYLVPDAFWAAFRRAVAALRPGGRFAAMLFGDRDASAGDPEMSHPSPDAIRAALEGFEFEHWVDKEEDGKTALGEPHHYHMVEFVARKPGR